MGDRTHIYRTDVWIIGFLGLFVCSGMGSGQQAFFDLPELPPPEEYGTVLIDRLTREDAADPVAFAHWSHRDRYTCRVCHFELGFTMETNGSGITEEANRKGEYCGACHDGETAFGHTEEHCTTCHTGRVAGKSQMFKRLRKFPKAAFGNRIDWVAAEDKGLIAPVNSILESDFEPIPFNEKFEVPAAWTLIPPAHFSHQMHLRWLECSNCHPDVFKIRKKGTEHFLMKHILEGRFCGVCHLTVAFPLDDCRRCHPDMKP